VILAKKADAPQEEMKGKKENNNDSEIYANQTQHRFLSPPLGRRLVL
jgi:hypothetical protein